MAREALPHGLLHEADLMVRTLIEELRGADEVELLTTRTRGLPRFPALARSRWGPPMICRGCSLWRWMSATPSGPPLRRPVEYSCIWRSRYSTGAGS